MQAAKDFLQMQSGLREAEKGMPGALGFQCYLRPRLCSTLNHLELHA